jgi:hypothetical protein
MPNHLHALINFVETPKTMNSIIGEGKRFMAYEIVRKLEQKGEIDLLSVLSSAVLPSDRKRNKKHEVWEGSFDWKHCWNDKLIRQKLNYMHNNPCRGKWNLCDNSEKYIHSSAGFYATGQQGVFRVTNYLDNDV